MWSMMGCRRPAKVLRSDDTQWGMLASGDISRGRMISNGYADRRGPKVGTATKGGCAGSRRNAMIG